VGVFAAGALLDDELLELLSLPPQAATTAADATMTATAVALLLYHCIEIDSLVGSVGNASDDAAT
jgi:hypothetical protein